MKNFNIIIMMCLMVLGTSCKKSLEDQFKNPDSYDPAASTKIPGLFTDMMTKGKFYYQDYGEWYYMIGDGFGIAGYSQLAQRYITQRYDFFSTWDDVVGGNGFDASSSTSLFGDMYTSHKGLPLIQERLKELSGTELQDSKIYETLCLIMTDWAVAKNVDLFNSIPYSEAFKGASGVYFPKYDDPLEIYHTIMENLKKEAADLPGLYSQMSPLGKTLFANQDLAFHGDINKWVQYANALRLKYAVRIAGVDEAFAKSHIADVLTKQLPQTDFTIALTSKNEIPGGGTWLRGFYERNFAAFIPNIIVKRMNYGTTAYEPGTDDPRLPVIAMPTKFNNNNDYRGVSYNGDAQTAPYNAGEKYYPYADDVKQALEQNAKSTYNHATYCRNEFPNYMFSLAEVDLLLAEVALKGLGSTGKSASAHIVDAITHSTDFWYNINALSTYALDRPILHPTKPNGVIVTTYANTVKAKFEAAVSADDKMELLMQQKYVHLNMMAPYELFTELRRTHHPKLEPMTINGKVMKPMAERILYPSVSELAKNPTNYMKVKSQDNYTSHIFWVPGAVKSLPYYWDNYNYQ
ncbi:MAG TPA: SusD/RagB family nutrient-binding outer membrane lipoprotein [Pedobacter sp.]|nr:SusD/RagB family nutrient-binding outer membrane lipoprotein [Pedobacter sp.]